jgi:NAD(P)H dehydrogenase (quinone)
MSAILVTGASGALGRAVTRALVADGQSDLILGSRTPGMLSEFEGPSTRLRRVDFDEPATLGDAFSEVGRALLISTDELAEPGKRRRQHRAALQAASRAGVRHVAYTSMPNPKTSGPVTFAGDHAAVEDELAESGLGYTSLRNSWYAENLLAYLPAIVRDGTWFTAAGEGRIAYVTRDDAAAAAVLGRNDGLGPLDVAGPDALTVDEIAACVSDATGRSLKIEHVGPDRLAVELNRQGVPPAVIPLVVMTEVAQALGSFDVSPAALTSLLGRRLQPLSQFLHEHRDDLLARAG